MKSICIKVGLLIAFVFVIILFLQNNEKIKYQKNATSLINKIEAFRKSENRLPNNVTELGLEEAMNSGPYYEKKDSTYYVIYFTIGFDETLTYHSDEKKWVWE
jgi:uncharacterized membrane protein YgaE (UPF0421/DUF939 family)